MLEVKDIRFNYHGQTHFPGLRNVSLSVDRGEVMALLGGSGSGKTTALRCIYGLEDVKEGKIILNGEEVLGPSFNLMPGHADMKLVSQDFYILDHHTVLENITDRLPLVSNTTKLQRAEQLMKLLEISDLRNQKAANLSSGQKQRVAIARALAVIPKVLLLDEPFSNLDHKLAAKLLDFITKEVRRKKSAMILVTHLAEEALKYADTVAVMDAGKIVQQGSTAEVYYNPKNSKIAALFGSFNLLRKKDLQITSALGESRSRIFARPDRIKPWHSSKGSDLSMKVTGSLFNGKCYEISGITGSGKKLVIFHHAAIPADEVVWLKYEPVP